MRFFINLLLIILILGNTEESWAQQQHDTTLEGHTIIVKGKYHYKLPVIRDANFCKKLKGIKIPKNMTFIDSSDGREISYFFSFTLIFSKMSNIPSIKEEKTKNQDNSIKLVSTDIMALLKHEEWKVYSGSQNHEIEFSCTLTRRGIEQAVLESIDNFDLKNVCE